MISLHRKYRPQTVDELDQAKVRQFFEGILKSGTFSQAYLFAGPKGTGKTSGARILAKIVNCEKNDKVSQRRGDTVSPLKEPCNTCSACVAITNGASSAVLEMDAASNRGIDDIRQLREQINLVPADAKYAVYIIDEVHMLTNEAFNALLKTLEEPPAHAIFCLATTEFDKLPGTITSRCTQVSYSRSTTEEIIRSLQRVVKGEQVDITDAALEAIADHAQGSFRDAVTQLENVLNQDKKITLELVEEFSFKTSKRLVHQLITDLLNGQVESALATVDAANAKGLDMQDLAKTVVEEATTQLKQELAQTQKVNQSLFKLIEVVSQSFKRFADVPIPALPIEMAVVEYCLTTDKVESSNTPPTKPIVPEKKTPVSPTRNLASANVKKNTTKTELPVKSSDTTEQKAAIATTTQPVRTVKSSTLLSISLEEVRKQWNKVLAELSQRNHGLVTLLKRGKVSQCQDGVVSISVAYDFHKEQLQQERYVVMIEEVLAQVYGGLLKMTVILEEAKPVPARLKPHQNVSVPKDTKDDELVSAVEDAFGI